MVPSLPWMDSCPSHDAGGGFLVEFEAFRTPSHARARPRAIFTGHGDGVGRLRHRRDSWPSHVHESGFFVEFEYDRAAQVNLGALNERWAKIEFLCDFYKGTDVPLLKFGEEDYEALENDQLTVQGMMASRYVAQFEKEVSMWSVSLLNVADVFTCARGVPCGAFTPIRLVAISQ